MRYIAIPILWMFRVIIIMMLNFIHQNVHRNMTTTSLDGKKFYLVEVIAFVLKYLKHKLEEHLSNMQQPLKSDEFDWVITVPAIWKARGKRMMREAAYMVYVYAILLITVIIFIVPILTGRTHIS